MKTGIPGRSNDSGAFNYTKLHSLLQQGTVLPASTRYINNTLIPYHLLADSAFKRANWLAKPLRTTVPIQENYKKYNKVFSSARVHVENAFGRLKGRWKRLYKDPFECKLNDVATVIYAAAILHNMCETNDDIFYNEWMSTDSSSTSPSTSNVVDFRVALANYYFKNSVYT